MFQALAVQLGVNLGVWAINKYLLDERKKFPKPEPDGLEFPLTTIGSRVPMFYGTVRIDNPCLVHTMLYGNYWESSALAYRYGAVMVFVVGTPPAPVGSGMASAIDSPVLKRFWYGDKVATMTLPGGVFAGDISHGNFKIAHVDLGGDGSGGSFNAVIEFFDGRPDQMLTSYPSIPATKEIDKAYYRSAAAGSGLYRGHLSSYRYQTVVAVIADVGYGNPAFGTLNIGESAQVAAIGIEIEATGANGFSDFSAGESFGDANPAMVLYDMLCGRVFKLGIPESKVDTQSFEDAADALFIEKHGCSMLISSEEDAPAAMSTLLRQIDGVIVEDKQTGKLKLKLVRADYVIGDLQEINEDNVIGRPEIGVTGFIELANEVVVYFTNRSREYKRDSASASRLSISVGQDSRYRPREVDYPACSNATLAAKLAARDANVACKPLMTVVCTVNREFVDVEVADVLKMNLSQYGIVDKPLRVLDVDEGQLADGKIRLTMVEDVFGNELGSFETDPGIVPSEEVLPIVNRVFEQAPQWLIEQAYFAGHVTNTTDARILGAGRREPNVQLATFNVVMTSVSGIENIDVPARNMATSAIVVTDYPRTAAPYDTTTGLVIEDVTGELAEVFESNSGASIFDGGLLATPDQVSGGANLIFVGTTVDGKIVDGEFMAFESVTVLGGGQYRLNNVWRELLDTAADDHPAGDVVFMIEYPRVGQRAQSVLTYTLTGKDQPVPVPITGSLPVDQLDTISYDSAVATRNVRPYKAADLRLNALEMCSGVNGIPVVADSFTALASFDGAIDATWRQRIMSSFIVRGDEVDATQIISEAATFTFYARKVGGVPVAIVSVLRDAGSSEMSKTGLLVGAAGHGQIDVLLRTQDASGDDSWNDARCRVSAHRARNLLANGGCQYGNMTGWTTPSGSSTPMTGTYSLEQTAGGSWFRLQGTAS